MKRVTQQTDMIRPVKVMAFNLRINAWLDGRNAWAKRINKVVQVLQKHNPLIVGTQEGLPNMLADLDQRLQAYGRIGTGREIGEQGEHCAIFYRKDALSLEDSGQFWLSGTPDVPSKDYGSACFRICTWGTFRLRDANHIRFRLYNTHLDHKSEAARDNGSAVIWKHIEAHQRKQVLPVILTGDMNATPKENVIQFWRQGHSMDNPAIGLHDAYLAAGLADARIGRTYHGFRGGTDGLPIDYIFATRDIEVVRVQIDRDKVHGGYPSDHYPVLVEFRMG